MHGWGRLAWIGPVNLSGVYGLCEMHQHEPVLICLSTWTGTASCLPGTSWGKGERWVNASFAWDLEKALTGLGWDAEEGDYALIPGGKGQDKTNNGFLRIM